VAAEGAHWRSPTAGPDALTRRCPDRDRDPVAGQHRGIFWVEIGVLVTVSGVMLKVFYMFAGRGRGS